MAKSLKFDIRLATGTIEKNLKRCVNGLSTTWRNFGKNMKKSNSALDIANAFTMLGKNAYSSLMRLVAPYQMVVENTVAAVMAVKQLCAQYEELERVSLRASNAFKTGGRMGTGKFEKYEKKATELASNGNIRKDEAMTGLASLAQNNHSLDEKTVDRFLNVSKDAAAFLGEDYASTMSRLGDILDDTTTSYETLRGAGLEFTMAEINQIKALKESYQQTEANAIILKKMEETYKGAESAQSKTITGMFQNFSNQWNDIMASIGKALAPILQLVMGIVNPVMEVVKFLASGFEMAGDVLSEIASRISALFEGFVEPIMEALKLMKDSATQLFNTMTAATVDSKTAKEALKAIGQFLGKIVASVISFWTVLQMIYRIALIPILAIIKVLSGFVERFVRGFKTGIGNSFKMTDGWKALYNIINRIIGIISKLWDLIADNPVTAFLGSVIEKLGIIVGFLLSSITTAIETVTDFVDTAIDKIEGAVTGIKNSILGLFGIKPKPIEIEEEKKEEDEKKGWQDPRNNFRASFESAESMNQRIQTSIMSKNSPYAKMENYLGQIQGLVSQIIEGQQVTIEASGAQISATMGVNKSIQNQQLGMIG